jgi:glucosamine-6-phosphate deaminase
MEVVILPDADAVAREAADRIADLVLDRPDAVLGVATGSSPLGVYAELAARVRGGALSFRSASAFALDEYVGLPPGDPHSSASELDRVVTGPLGFWPAAVRVPDGAALDPGHAAAVYDRMIAFGGGIDLQLLGIGVNGRIGFNEPASSFTSRTRVKVLAPRTRFDTARFFGGDVDAVPRHCITQGIGTILEARTIVLVALGEAKAPAVAGLVEGPVTTMLPASALQQHDDVVVIVDDAAASTLRLADYYRALRTQKILRPYP